MTGWNLDIQRTIRRGLVSLTFFIERILHQCSCLFGKRDKMRGLPSILSLFFGTSLIRARMLDSIYHMT